MKKNVEHLQIERVKKCNQQFKKKKLCCGRLVLAAL